MQKVIDALDMEKKRTILFVDKIHKFNKAQQDYLLPFVEDGIVILIGTTTENPYFEVKRALISRSKIFNFKPLSLENIRTLLLRTMIDREKGPVGWTLTLTTTRRFSSPASLTRCRGHSKCVRNRGPHHYAQGER